MAGKQGRPAWEPDEEAVETVRALAAAGVDRKGIAAKLGIAESTLYAKLHEFPELMEAIKNGRQSANAVMQATLFNKALSGDTTALIFWLKAQAGWRDSDADKVKWAELELKRESMAKGLPDPGVSPSVILTPPDSDDWKKHAGPVET